MTAVMANSKLGRDLIAALGIDDRRLRSVLLEIEARKPVQIVATYLLDDASAVRAIETIRASAIPPSPAPACEWSRVEDIASAGLLQAHDPDARPSAAG